MPKRGQYLRAGPGSPRIGAARPRTWEFERAVNMFEDSREPPRPCVRPLTHAHTRAMRLQTYFLEVASCGVVFDGVVVKKSSGTAKGAGCVCVVDDGRVTFFNQPPFKLLLP